MKGIYEKNYDDNNQVVLQFHSLLGNQAPTEMIIEPDSMKVSTLYNVKYSYGQDSHLRFNFGW